MRAIDNFSDILIAYHGTIPELSAALCSLKDQDGIVDFYQTIRNEYIKEKIFQAWQLKSFPSGDALFGDLNEVSARIVFNNVSYFSHDRLIEARDNLLDSATNDMSLAYRLVSVSKQRNLDATEKFKDYIIGIIERNKELLNFFLSLDPSLLIVNEASFKMIFILSLSNEKVSFFQKEILFRGLEVSPELATNHFSHLDQFISGTNMPFLMTKILIPRECKIIRNLSNNPHNEIAKAAALIVNEGIKLYKNRLLPGNRWIEELVDFLCR